MGHHHHTENLLVTDLAPNAPVNVYPADGYDGCVVLIPDRNSGEAAGSSFLAVLFVSREGAQVPYTVPNQAGCCLVHTSGFFTSAKSIERALAAAGKPGPPVIVT